MDPAQMLIIVPPPPDVLTFSELLGDHSILSAKEQSDKDLLESIWVQHVSGFKTKLVEWVMKGCPNVYPILELIVQPPPKCADGLVRGLADYIHYCSGKTIYEHVNLLQAKLPDIRVEFANIGGAVTIVVSKPP